MTAAPGAEVAAGEEAHTAELEGVLDDARRRGLLGPGSLDAQIAHAKGFAEAAGPPPEGVALDLGSGGGLPGLVLATEWPGSRWVLLDGRARSAEFLAEAVDRLGLGDRAAVRQGRAEEAAHESELRGVVRLVVARGLGGPAVTAECAAGFLDVGGRLVVSEPPGSAGERWPAQGLATLGLGPARVVQTSGGYGFAVLRQERPCPSPYPRRVGVPAKRPLF